MLVKCTICRGMHVGQVYNLYRYTCLFAGKSSVMTSKRSAPNDLPGPAPRAQAARTGPRAPRVAIPEPTNEPVPSAAPNPAGAGRCLGSGGTATAPRDHCHANLSR